MTQRRCTATSFFQTPPLQPSTQIMQPQLTWQLCSCRAGPFSWVSCLCRIQHWPETAQQALSSTQHVQSGCSYLGGCVQKGQRSISVQVWSITLPGTAPIVPSSIISARTSSVFLLLICNSYTLFDGFMDAKCALFLPAAPATCNVNSAVSVLQRRQMWLKSIGHSTWMSTPLLRR